MNKRIILFLVAVLTESLTVVNAKINYIPLYIVDTQPDVKVVKRTPASPLFITQDDHILIMPDIEDSLTFMVLSNNTGYYNLLGRRLRGQPQHGRVYIQGGRKILR